MMRCKKITQHVNLVQLFKDLLTDVSCVFIMWSLMSKRTFLECVYESTSITNVHFSFLLWNSRFFSKSKWFYCTIYCTNKKSKIFGHFRRIFSTSVGWFETPKYYVNTIKNEEKLPALAQVDVWKRPPMLNKASFRHIWLFFNHFASFNSFWSQFPNILQKVPTQYWFCRLKPSSKSNTLSFFLAIVNFADNFLPVL